MIPFHGRDLGGDRKERRVGFSSRNCDAPRRHFGLRYIARECNDRCSLAGRRLVQHHSGLSGIPAVTVSRFRDNREQVQIWWCSCLSCRGDAASRPSKDQKSVAMQCTNAPKRYYGRQKIRRDHEIRAGERLSEIIPQIARVIRISIDVEIVAGHLRIRGVRPI